MSRDALKNTPEKPSAAVLAAIVLRPEQDGGDALLLEVRADHVPQPGEVCFPGGHIEAGESPQQTAVRETIEELGFSESDIAVTAVLAPDRVYGGRIVVPVLGQIQASALEKAALSECEVAGFFLLPLSWLRQNPAQIFETDAAGRYTKPLPPILQGYLAHYPRSTKTLYWEYDGHGIWGLTARIIANVLDTLSNGGTIQ